MAANFKAETFQNEFLPAGTADVHAIMTVTAGESAGADSVSPGAGTGGRLFGILCDVSGSMEGGKILAAKGAIATVVRLLPEDCHFFIVTGSDSGYVVCPTMRADAAGKQRALAAIKNVQASGGTRISQWLTAALNQFQATPAAVRQALLLTDGQNDPTDQHPLTEILKRCEGMFQCDCRGVGTDWRVEQLRMIAGALLGTTDIIRSPAEIEADFTAILGKSMAKTMGAVSLRLWAPQGARVKFCKEVSPEIVDLTGKARQVKPQLLEYPTGAWGKGEARDFHFCIQVNPGNVGDEVLAGRASLIYIEQGVETKLAEARILAVWTDDEGKSAKIDRVVAHYTGQAELAQSIQEGLDARAHGDTEKATVLLGKAVKIAAESGNEATSKLLRRVVDVEDAETGTVRLKQAVAKEDSMALETRSTKTARIAKVQQEVKG
jgi:hypothetical protein